MRHGDGRHQNGAPGSGTSGRVLVLDFHRNPRATKCSDSIASSGDATTPHASPRVWPPRKNSSAVMRSAMYMSAVRRRRDLERKVVGAELGDRHPAPLDREVEQHDVLELLSIAELVDPVDQRLELALGTRRESRGHVQAVGATHLGRHRIVGNACRGLAQHRAASHQPLVATGFSGDVGGRVHAHVERAAHDR